MSKAEGNDHLHKTSKQIGFSRPQTSSSTTTTRTTKTLTSIMTSQFHTESSTESSSSDDESIANLSTPSRQLLTCKMKSAGDILGNKSSCGGAVSRLSSEDDDYQVMDLIKSFGNSKLHGPSTSHFITSNLDSEVNSNIEDSHTSYRKLIETEITELKIRLAEAQEKADTLQNNFNRISIEKGVLQASLDGLAEKYDNTRRHCDELGAVVAHFKENAKESSTMKRLLEERVERSNKDYQVLQRKNKQLRHENRKLLKQLKLAGSDLEGQGMENQGLKSENDWLKKQLQDKLGNIFSHGSKDVSDLEESSDDEEPITDIRELISYTSASRRNLFSQRSMSKSGKAKESTEEGKRSVEEESILLETFDEYASFIDDSISKGVSSALTSSSLPPISTMSTNINTNNNDLRATDSNKTATKWSWWSPFDMGNSETNLNNVYAEEDGKSKFPDGGISNPPPKLTVESSSQHKSYAEPSTKRLVPRRLNDVQ